MNSALALFGYALARKSGRHLREISWWNFDQWKKAGMTHVCLSCAPSPVGFRLDPGGKAAGMNGLENQHLSTHGEGCAHAVMGNLQEYDNPADWVEKEKGQAPDFLLAYPAKV